MQSNDDTVVLWNYAPIGGDIHIYRPNVGTGAWDNVTSRAGLGISTAIAIQSNDHIITGNADGQVKYYDSAIGDLVQISGLGSIGALACLSDDTVIAGSTSGALYALAADGSSILGFDLGYGTVSAIAVQSDDDVIVANAEGVLRRVTIDFSGAEPGVQRHRLRRRVSDHHGHRRAGGSRTVDAGAVGGRFDCVGTVAVVESPRVEFLDCDIHAPVAADGARAIRPPRPCADRR